MRDLRDWETKARKKLVVDKMIALNIAQGDPQLLSTQLEWQHKFIEAEEEDD